MANRQPRYVASESLPAERRAPPVDFREVVEASLQGVAILDHLQIRYVNPEFAGMFGYDTPDQLVGENWDRLVAIEDLPLVREIPNGQRFDAVVIALKHRGTDSTTLRQLSPILSIMSGTRMMRVF